MPRKSAHPKDLPQENLPLRMELAAASIYPNHPKSMMQLAAAIQGVVNDQPTQNFLTKHIYQLITTAIGTLCDIFGPSSASWSSNIQVPNYTATVVLATRRKAIDRQRQAHAASIEHHLPSIHTCKCCKLICAYLLSYSAQQQPMRSCHLYT